MGAFMLFHATGLHFSFLDAFQQSPNEQLEPIISRIRIYISTVATIILIYKKFLFGGTVPLDSTKGTPAYVCTYSLGQCHCSKSSHKAVGAIIAH